MKLIRSILDRLSIPLALGGLCGSISQATAETVTYTVDPRQSRITLSTSFGGTFGWGQFTITNQLPGALANCWEGSIVGDTQPDGSILFKGGSSITALLNPNSPNPDPTQPSFHPTGDDPTGQWAGVDNYGLLCFLYDSAPIYAAYRDLVLDITSGSATTAGTPAEAMTLQFTDGRRDWSVAALGTGDSKRATAWPIAGGVNLSAGNVTISADRKTLTIPVVLATKSFDNVIVTFQEIWTGTIVAVAGAPTGTPPAPRVTLTPSGPAGLQFNASGGAISHHNGITTAPWVECSWVGVTTQESPSTYSFTIAAPPSRSASGFLAYLWLVPNPISYSTEAYSGHANPNVLRLNLESNGPDGVTATLGYKVNSPDDDSGFLGSGFLCGITNTPFAGTWTLRVKSDTEFTLIAPNGAEATGAMLAEDAALFKEKVRLYLGVNPNGAKNLGESMTLSTASILIPGGGRTSLIGTFDTGGRLNKNWTILAADPASILVKPALCRYRAEWQERCGGGPGIGFLEHNDSLFDPTAWTPVEFSGSLLANGRTVAFISEADAALALGFYRAMTP